jgi:hypothetical protein
MEPNGDNMTSGSILLRLGRSDRRNEAGGTGHSPGEPLPALRAKIRSSKQTKKDDDQPPQGKTNKKPLQSSSGLNALHQAC